MIWIRVLVNVSNARGVFGVGDEVLWPEQDAQPLIAMGAAEEIDGPTADDTDGDGVFGEGE